MSEVRQRSAVGVAVRGGWRRAVAASSLAAMLAVATPAVPALAAPALVGQSAPDFVLKSLDGRNLRLSEYRGQVVLLNFWARWAGDSRAEMAALDRIDTVYQRAGLVVLGVSVDDDLRRSREFAEAMKVSYPLLFDEAGETGRSYRLQKMPVTLLVDRSGVVRYASVGFKRGDERDFVEHIRELLRE